MATNTSPASVKLLKTTSETALLIKADITFGDLEIIQALAPKKLCLCDEDKNLIFTLRLSSDKKIESASIYGISVYPTKKTDKINMRYELTKEMAPELVNATGIAIQKHLSQIVTNVKEFLATTRTETLEEVNA